MKKLFPILGAIALVLGMVAFIVPMAKAAAPAGTMTSTALTVDLGQLKAINAITVTDAGAEIDATTDIKIKIPDGVNAIWDIADTTAVINVTGTTGAVSTTVSYESVKILVLNVTADFTDGDAVTVSGLSMIGQTATSVATALEWAVDGATYRVGNDNTQVTVADGAEDTLTSATVVPYDPVTGATTTYAVNFTVPATGVIPYTGKIKITFPEGFDITAADITTATGIDGTFTADGAGQVLTITRSGTGTNATAGAKVINLSGVVNGAAGAGHTATIATTTAADAALASVVSPAFTVLAVPATVTDLACTPSGQAGAIWLRWTVPAGASTTYEAKHYAAAINDGNYAAATTISQSWAIGTKAAVKQELVAGLNPGTRYYFALKSGGFGATTSNISSTSPTCIAPSSATSAPDSTAPVTLFTYPALNSTVQSGTVVIKGTAKDTGGSSVQKVEVSLDGGNTWSLATVTGDDGANVIWEFAVANASVGTMSVKARATDWTNNVETNGPTLTFNVSSTAHTTPSTPATPSTGEQATVAQLQTQLQTLRVQLLNLLMQLVAKLQAQLSALQ